MMECATGMSGVFQEKQTAGAKVLRQENPQHIQGTVRGSKVINSQY